jgi:hypothetical protein
LSDEDSDDDYSENEEKGVKCGDANGEVRGSRTNCKGHWSKEEVKNHLLILFFLLIKKMIIGSTLSRCS